MKTRIFLVSVSPMSVYTCVDSFYGAPLRDTISDRACYVLLRGRLVSPLIMTQPPRGQSDTINNDNWCQGYFGLPTMGT